MTRRVVLHIDALQLVGVDPSHARALVGALREGLAGALGSADAVQALSGRAGHVDRLSAAPLRVAHDAAPRRVGRLIADRIARGVTR